VDLTGLYNEAMTDIRVIAQCEFKQALDKERGMRLWSHGLAVNDDLKDTIAKEQGSILANIQGVKTEDT
jgi:hypothetical protein